jgi:ABC-type Mn2+/Zn2+ transport system ATPase subunit
MSDELIRLNNVCIGYGHALMSPINLTLARGQSWGVVGPNGAGKTTLAKTILGLLAPVSGRVEMLTPGLRLSYSPQRHRLNPYYPLSAFDVVLMGRNESRSCGVRYDQNDRRRAAEELARLDMQGLATKLFRSLSGGQQQRVLLARVLAADPDVLVLDEPAEGMDLLGTFDILSFLKTIDAARRMAVVMISHQLSDVISTVDTLCLINQYTDMFEMGPLETMISSEKLTRLYGRPIGTHICDGTMHVHVQEP